MADCQWKGEPLHDSRWASSFGALPVPTPCLDSGTDSKRQLNDADPPFTDPVVFASALYSPRRCSTEQVRGEGTFRMACPIRVREGIHDRRAEIRSFPATEPKAVDRARCRDAWRHGSGKRKQGRIPAEWKSMPAFTAMARNCPNCSRVDMFCNTLQDVSRRNRIGETDGPFETTEFRHSAKLHPFPAILEHRISAES